MKYNLRVSRTVNLGDYNSMQLSFEVLEVDEAVTPPQVAFEKVRGFVLRNLDNELIQLEGDHR